MFAGSARQKIFNEKAVGGAVSEEQLPLRDRRWHRNWTDLLPILQQTRTVHTRWLHWLCRHNYGLLVGIRVKDSLCGRLILLLSTVLAQYSRFHNNPLILVQGFIP